MVKVEQPEFRVVAFDMDALLGEMRALVIPDDPRPVKVFFLVQPTLACIEIMDDRAHIKIHAALNHRRTPVEVMRYVLKHELLHMKIRPELIDGKEIGHPPAFWEAEEALVPERRVGGAWLGAAFYPCLKIEKKKERIIVKRCWPDCMSQKWYEISGAAACLASMTPPQDEIRLGAQADPRRRRKRVE